MSAGNASGPTSKPGARRSNKPSALNGVQGGRPAAVGRSASTIDPLSDRATLMLIRKTLCPETLSDKNRDAMQPIEELLPSLTSRNDVDLQLYAFLAIVLREFVQVWYNKITPDETFVQEILHVIAHCTRALEQRFRKVDLERLVLDEIPDLLDRHITGMNKSGTMKIVEDTSASNNSVLPFGDGGGGGHHGVGVAMNYQELLLSTSILILILILLILILLRTLQMTSSKH